MIGFEQANYDTSEIEGSVEVCIDVRNGDLVTDLTVELTVLPSSTAIGMYNKQSIIYVSWVLYFSEYSSDQACYMSSSIL